MSTKKMYEVRLYLAWDRHSVVHRQGVPLLVHNDNNTRCTRIKCKAKAKRMAEQVTQRIIDKGELRAAHAWEYRVEEMRNEW